MVYVDARTKKNYFCELFHALPFLACYKIFWERLGKTDVPTRKAVLEKTYLALGRWLGYCLP
jgi:hypothetical protein